MRLGWGAAASVRRGGCAAMDDLVLEGAARGGSGARSMRASSCDGGAPNPERRKPLSLDASAMACLSSGHLVDQRLDQRVGTFLEAMETGLRDGVPFVLRQPIGWALRQVARQH